MMWVLWTCTISLWIFSQSILLTGIADWSLLMASSPSINPVTILEKYVRLVIDSTFKHYIFDYEVNIIWIDWTLKEFYSIFHLPFNVDSPLPWICFNWDVMFILGFKYEVLSSIKIVLYLFLEQSLIARHVRK